MKGVTSGAKAVVIAVRDTESSTFPLESDDMKLEMFPPGQDATRIIPNAIMGVITGERIRATANVTAGRATHCRNIPTNTDFGFLNTSLKVWNFIPSATPNIINASIMFTTAIPPWPKLMLRALRLSNCSFIVCRFSSLQIYTFILKVVLRGCFYTRKS